MQISINKSIFRQGDAASSLLIALFTQGGVVYTACQRRKTHPIPSIAGASHPMKSIKTQFALAVLSGLLAIPAARVLFAADKPDTPAPAQTTDTAAPNTLTDAEKAAGWKLLFDGKSMDGWHSFKRDTVRPGWKIEDGTLACVDPKNAGDL